MAELRFISDVVKGVCDTLHVTEEDIRSSSRHKSLVLARMLIANLTKHMVPMASSPEVAAAIGRKSHSQIITHRQMGRDPQVVTNAVEACIAEFRDGKIIYRAANWVRVFPDRKSADPTT